MSANEGVWHGNCDLRFIKRSCVAGPLTTMTSYQGKCIAPLKLMRGSNNADGRFEIPLLHTAGGLVGGDQLRVNVTAEEGTSGLMTSVAAQKVYGSIGLSTRHPEGKWSKQRCQFAINKCADFEWLPQELVLFGNGLYQQNMSVYLYPNSSFLSAEIVRLGRTAAGERLGSGCWRSRLEIRRNLPDRSHWEFIDQLELSGEALSSDHGMANQPVFGSLIWVAPYTVSKDMLNELVKIALKERNQLEGLMSCSAIEHGISARFLGSSSQFARYWFFRIWTQTRIFRELSRPKFLRLWPMQEDPFAETM